MAESDEPTPQEEKRFCNIEGGKYIAINGQSLKKSPSVWSFRDYPCEAYGKTFTQCHTLHTHRKYHCKRLQTEKIPREECLNCGKMVHKTTLGRHR